MDPQDEEVIVRKARNAWAKVPGLLKPLLPDLSVILRRVPEEALDYTVREVLEVLPRAHRQGRI